MKKIKDLLKKSYGWLALFLVVALLCSLFAAIVNTSFFSVKVTKVTVDMGEFYDEHQDFDNPVASSFKTNEDGSKINLKEGAKLVGNFYIPRGVDENHPAPCVILTHGYLNSKEFEEAPAIEMSRRGYVVFAFDQYDHGESTWNTNNFGSFAFFMHSVYDAVQYVYEQPFVLKAADGAGMISVSGHSMGGFSSEAASVADGMRVSYGASPKITVCLAVGADWMYLGGTSLMPYLGNKTCGTIAGEYDEFFFDTASEATGETVRRKDYLADPTGMAFLGVTERGENGHFYEVSGGERVIYQVAGDHPYNTWSPEATARMIEFYNHAFDYQANLHGATLPSTLKTELKGQSWWLKDVFTCIGMIAFVGVIITLALTLVKLPVFKEVVTPEELLTPAEPNGLVRTIVGIAASVVSCILGVIYIPAFMDQNEHLAEIQTIGLVFAIVAGVIAVASVVVNLFVNNEKAKEITKNGLFGGLLIVVVALALRWFAGDGTRLFSNSNFFTADSITVVVYWAVGSGLLGLLFTLASHFFIQKNRDASHLGLKASLKQVVMALLIAVVVCGAAWFVLQLSDWIFGVDYRVYIYAFRPATAQSFEAALRYLPFFFIFYLCAGLAVANGTYGLDGWKADAVTAGVSVAPVIIFMIIAYSSQMITGVSVWPTFALNVIVVQNLVWTLAFLAIIQRRTLKATGNIWTGVFINSIWFTMITLASTCIYLF